MITKSIYKSKFSEIQDQITDLNSFCDKIKQTLINNYVTNSSMIMFDFLFEKTSLNNMQNTFYEKYNSHLVETTPFTDIRSTLLDAVLTLSDSFKELFEIEKINRIVALIKEILNKVITKIAEYMPEIGLKLEKLEYDYNYITQVSKY